MNTIRTPKVQKQDGQDKINNRMGIWTKVSNQD